MAGDGTILPLDPLDTASEAIWRCNVCLKEAKQEAIQKLVVYFMDKLRQPLVKQSVDALEDMLEKAGRLLHPNHYVVTLIRVSMNDAYIRLTEKMFGEDGDYKDQPIPVEVYMVNNYYSLSVISTYVPNSNGNLIFHFREEKSFSMMFTK